MRQRKVLLAALEMRSFQGPSEGRKAGAGKRSFLLTRPSMLRYTASMPIQFILPKKFTRAQIEWRMDEMALQFQGTRDKKLLAQIAALNRVLARMDEREPNSSNPRNRQ